jgi:hypothetical protein
LTIFAIQDAFGDATIIPALDVSASAQHPLWPEFV